MARNRRPSNRFIANVTGLVAFAATLAALGLAGFAVAALDSGGGEGRSPLLAIAVLVAASAALGIAARVLAWLILKRARPDGV